MSFLEGMVSHDLDDPDFNNVHVENTWQREWN
jgi:hypothetical protein